MIGYRFDGRGVHGRLLSMTALNPHHFPEFTESEAGKLVEWAARGCYASRDKMGTAPKFLEGLLKRGHMDIFEHVSFTFEVNGSSSAEMVLRMMASPPGRFMRFSPVYSGAMIDESDAWEKFWEGHRPTWWLVSGNARSWWELCRVFDPNDELKSFYPYLAVGFPELFRLRFRDQYLESYRHDVHEAIAHSAIAHDDLDADVGPINYMYSHLDLLGWNTIHFLDESYRKKHTWAVWELTGVSRSLTHQLVRHRLFSFSQSSLRYIDQGDEMHVVLPMYGNREKLSDDQVNKADAAMLVARHDTLEAYKMLRELGIQKGDARFVLPIGISQSIVFGGPGDGLEHFFWLRALDKAAQREIREWAQAMLYQLGKVSPPWMELWPKLLKVREGTEPYVKLPLDIEDSSW